MSFHAERASDPTQRLRLSPLPENKMGFVADPIDPVVSQGIFGTLGGIGGAVIGGITGGPAGAVAGFTAGKRFGSAFEGGSTPEGFQATSSDPCFPLGVCDGPVFLGQCLGRCEPFSPGGSGMAFPNQPTIPAQPGVHAHGVNGSGSACACQPRKCPSPTSCTKPDGRTGKTNKSRYYRFGDCRRGTGPGVVEPNTVCVTSRRTDFGNMRAAKRAASRLNGAARHMHKIIDAVDNITAAKKRKPSKK